MHQNESYFAFAKIRLEIRVGNQELVLIFESNSSCVIPESQLAVSFINANALYKQ